MNVSRNVPCPCGSGKKYKKCCLAQDEKAAAEMREQRRAAEETERKRQLAEKVELEAFDEYALALEELTNRANDHIRAGQWDEADACCRQLREQFPKEIDGDHRSYEYYKARGDFIRAKAHAEATLRFVERDADGFDPELPTELKRDIVAFGERIQADCLTN